MGDDADRSPGHFVGGRTKDPDVVLRRAERRELVATLLVAGASLREMQDAIQRKMGIRPGRGTVADDVAVCRREWARDLSSSYEAHVTEHNARLDALWRAVAPQAMKGDTSAIDTALRVLDRKAKLLGLDQPDRLVVAATSSSRQGADRGWDDTERAEQVERALAIMAVLHEVDAFAPVEEEQPEAIDV